MFRSENQFEITTARKTLESVIRFVKGCQVNSFSRKGKCIDSVEQTPRKSVASRKQQNLPFRADKTEWKTLLFIP